MERATQETLDARHAHVLKLFETPIARGRIEVHRTTGVEAARFPEESLDFVYVDGDHAY